MLLYIFVLSVICIFILYYYSARSHVCESLADEEKNQSQYIFSNINQVSRISSSNCHWDSNESNDQSQNNYQTDDDFKTSDHALNHHKDICGSSRDYNQIFHQDKDLEERWNYLRYPRYRKKTNRHEKYMDDDVKITNKVKVGFLEEDYENFDSNSCNHDCNKRTLAWDCYYSFDEDDTNAVNDESSTEVYDGDDEDSEGYCKEQYLYDDVNYKLNNYCDEPEFCENGNQNINGALNYREEEKSSFRKQEDSHSANDHCSKAYKNILRKR